MLTVIIPFFLHFHNTLLHFYHSDILGGHRAFTQNNVPDLCYLRGGQSVAGGHDGQISPAGLQKAQAVREAFGFDQRFDLIFRIEIFQVSGQLLRVGFLFLGGEVGAFERFLDGIQCGIVGFFPLEAGFFKNLEPESFATLTSCASP